MLNLLNLVGLTCTVPYSSILDVPIEIHRATFQNQRTSNSTIIETVPFVSSCFFQVSVAAKEIPDKALPTIIGDPRGLIRLFIYFSYVKTNKYINHYKIF